MRAVALAALLGVAHAHGGPPQVVDILFPDHVDGPWLVDNLGLLEQREAGYAWLCDDAVNLLAGIDWLAPVAADGQTWVVSTRAGIYRTTDNGCSFASVGGPLVDHVTGPVLPHPARLNEVVVGTETLGIPNDVFFSEDGGQTWAAVGLDVQGRVRSLLRAVDPDVIYVSHADGAARSDDGGRTFAPIALGPADLEPPALPEEFQFRTTTDALTVYAVVERFPDSYVVRSADGGATWETLSQLTDTPDGLVVEGDRVLASTPFEGLLYSADGGRTWTPRPTPATFLSCLTRAPDGQIWACARGMILPWLVARTDDWGLSWQVTLQDYEQLTAGWGCPAGSPTAATCDSQCNPDDLTCAQAPDAGPPDIGVDAGPDAGPEPETESTRDGGCQTTPTPLLWSLLLLSVVRRVHP